MNANPLFNTIFNNAFSKAPYQWQTEITTSILHAKLCADDNIHCLCARPTGGRKSLLSNSLDVYLANINSSITPLLSLGADQTIKNQHSTSGPRHMLNSDHLDEIANDVDIKFAITDMEKNIKAFSTIANTSL